MSIHHDNGIGDISMRDYKTSLERENGKNCLSCERGSKCEFYDYMFDTDKYKVIYKCDNWIKQKEN